jgi:restriction system protein
MPVPDFQSFMVPVLQCAADGAERSSGDFRDQIASSVKLTPDELAQKLPSGAPNRRRHLCHHTSNRKAFQPEI